MELMDWSFIVCVFIACRINQILYSRSFSNMEDYSFFLLLVITMERGITKVINIDGECSCTPEGSERRDAYSVWITTISRIYLNDLVCTGDRSHLSATSNMRGVCIDRMEIAKAFCCGTQCMARMFDSSG